MYVPGGHAPSRPHGCVCDRSVVRVVGPSALLSQTYISQMNARVQAQLRERNPWDFRFISNLENVTVGSDLLTRSRTHTPQEWRSFFWSLVGHGAALLVVFVHVQESDELNGQSQAVVFASPGMLQSGLSRSVCWRCLIRVACSLSTCLAS